MPWRLGLGEVRGTHPQDSLEWLSQVPRPHAVFRLFVFLLLAHWAHAQSSVTAPGTTKAERDALSLGLRARIANNLATPAAQRTANQWSDSLYCILFLRERGPEAQASLQEAFEAAKEWDDALRYQLLEVAHGLFPTDFSEEVLAITLATTEPKVFAAGVHYRLRAAKNVRAEQARWEEELRSRFPQGDENPVLHCLRMDLAEAPRRRLTDRPKLKDLLRAPFLPGNVVLFSFQRHNRDWPGLTVIRGIDGKFLRTESGEYLAVPHLARSQSQLPGYLSNGNTPQGIFSWKGFAVSDNRYIGPTPNLQLRLPWEVSAAEFLHADGAIPDDEWPSSYAALLPASWQGYWPIWQTFHAGQAGRFDIIAHGTTIDPAYATGLPFHPNTPSLGCLTASELWSEQDGTRQKSDQAVLVDALKTAGTDQGFLVVVELNDKASPVLLREIQGSILSAEGEGSWLLRLFSR